jgi:hypothetical protein
MYDCDVCRDVPFQDLDGNLLRMITAEVHDQADSNSRPASVLDGVDQI